MKLIAKVDNRDELVELAQFRAAATDKPALLNIFGVLMQASVARTFREEGSPAGSWPKLAASTLLKKGYTTGHKLLILSGRLFGSITYKVDGDVLIVGTALVYAGVHQFGSKDHMGGVEGPRTRAQMMDVGEHQGTAMAYARYKMVKVKDRHGNAHRVPRAIRSSIGPKNRVQFGVAAHTRRQNIPARPFLVFRPEDPARLVSKAEAYLAGKAMRLGKVGGA
ncbi:MAG TPA: phage virion morphogenesis protein [Acidobacteriaceae bacterium]